MYIRGDQNSQSVINSRPLDTDPNKAISVTDLTFGFGGPAILKDLTLQLPKGCRAILVGANGAGKTTLLNILAGKRMVRPPVSILGKDPFSDMPDGITYLGTEFVSNPSTRRDVPVESLIESMGGNRYPNRRDALLHCLDIDPDWRMHQVSDGERRRVQIMLGLLLPWRLLLLDEVTVDLDVLVRRNLLSFLQRETETRPGGCSVLYATHIFDGIGSWPTHVVRISLGNIVCVRTTGAPTVTVMEDGGNGKATEGSKEIVEIKEDFPEMSVAREQAAKAGGADSPLLLVVEKWLREDYLKRNELEGASGRAGGRRKVHTRWDELKEIPIHGDRFDMYYDYYTGRD